MRVAWVIGAAVIAALGWGVFKVAMPAASRIQYLTEQWRICSAFGDDARAQAGACTAIIASNGPPLDRARAFDFRGQAHMRLNEAPDAIADYGRSITLNPDYYGVYYNRGAAYMRGEDYAHAIADLDAGLRLAPNTPGMLNEACWARAVSGSDLDGAARLCDQAITLAPNNASYLDSLGLVRFKQGRFAEALANYEAAIVIHPNYAHYIYGRAISLKGLGRDADADAAFAAALQIDAAIDDTYASYGVAR